MFRYHQHKIVSKEVLSNTISANYTDNFTIYAKKQKRICHYFFNLQMQ